MRSETEVNAAIEQYADTEDIFQTVFLKYALSSVAFENKEHEKAWFIRVTMNACRDLLKSFFRSRTVPLDELADQERYISSDNREVLEAVLSLREKYRDVVYLHYYEGYTAPPDRKNSWEKDKYCLYASYTGKRADEKNSGR